MKGIVFITGGSSGIGLATAKLLATEGYTVYAASRRGGENVEYPSSGGKLISLQLDINDEAQLQSAVNNIVSAEKRIDAVICNAGNGIAGAVEDTTIEEARYQFETSFFGTIKTIRSVLPFLRTQGFGKIITLSSVAGIIPIPFQGYYSAVKSSILHLTKVMKIELHPFGIDCCSILPGDTKTGFTANRKYVAAMDNEKSPYFETAQRSIKKMEKDEINGVPPEKVAHAISSQLKRKHMSTVVIPGIDYKFFGFLTRILPTRLFLFLLRKIYA